MPRKNRRTSQRGGTARARQASRRTTTRRRLDRGAKTAGASARQKSDDLAPRAGTAKVGTRAKRAASGARKPSRRAVAPRAASAHHARAVSAHHARAVWIESPNQHVRRSGQTLVTRNHEVIRQWAAERGAVPATVPGTERDGRPGILRFDFPELGGGRLRAVDWDEWFETFDECRLVFLFQGQLKSGRESSFFRLDGPGRDDT